MFKFNPLIKKRFDYYELGLWNRQSIAGKNWLLPKTIGDSLALGDLTHAGGMFLIMGDKSSRPAFKIDAGNNYDVIIGSDGLAVQPTLKTVGAYVALNEIISKYGLIKGDENVDLTIQGGQGSGSGGKNLILQSGKGMVGNEKSGEVIIRSSLYAGAGSHGDIKIQYGLEDYARFSGGNELRFGKTRIAIGDVLGSPATPNALYPLYINEAGNLPANFAGIMSLVRSNGSQLFSGLGFEAQAYGSGTGSPIGISGIAQSQVTGGAGGFDVTGMLARSAQAGQVAIANNIALIARVDHRDKDGVGGNVTESIALWGTWQQSYAYNATVARGITCLLEEPAVHTGTITTKWALMSLGDIQVIADKKFILDGDRTTKGDTYFKYDSATHTLELYVDGVLKDSWS